jgi:hypothetical protein
MTDDAWDLPDDVPSAEETFAEALEAEHHTDALRRERDAAEAPGDCANCGEKLTWDDLDDAAMVCMGCSGLMCTTCGLREAARNIAETDDCEPIFCDACKGEGLNLPSPPPIEF